MNTTQTALRCARCGSTQFLLPSGRELREEDTVTCNGCKGQIKVRDARQQARQAVEKALADKIGRMFK